MSQQITLVQRRFGVRLTFQFSAQQLTYTLRDYSGERQFSVPYEAINVLAPSTLIVNSVQFFRTLLVFPLLAIVASIGMGNADKMASQGFAILGAVLIALLFIGRLLRLFAIKYTMLQMSPAPPGAGNHSIRIMNDKKHPIILEEIRTRWKARLKQLHGGINLSNDASKEIAKFSWMKEHAIITEGEYREAVEKLRAYSAHNQPQPERRTLN